MKVAGKRKNCCSALSCFLSGPSIAIILPEIALTYVVVVNLLVSATVTFQPTKFTQLKSKTGERFYQGWQGGRQNWSTGVLLCPKSQLFKMKTLFLLLR